MSLEFEERLNLTGLDVSFEDSDLKKGLFSIRRTLGCSV